MPILDNLLCYYKFNDLSANNAVYNLATKQYDLIYSPGVGNSISKVTNGGARTGTDSLYKNSSSSTSLYAVTTIPAANVGNSLSVSMWIKLDEVINNDHIAFIRVYGNVTYRYVLTTKKLFKFGGLVDIDPRISTSANVWTHYVVTHSYNPGDGKVKITMYLNGSPISFPADSSNYYIIGTGKNGAYNSSGQLITSAGVTDGIIYVNQSSNYFNVNQDTNIDFFRSFDDGQMKGHISEVLIFNRELTSSDVTKLYTFDYPNSMPVIGTPPTITRIDISGSSFSVVFTPGTGGSPAPTTYKYSLDGGSYVDASKNTSPITISSGLTPGVIYAVRLIATNDAGDSSGSTPFNAAIPKIGTVPTITSITSGISSLIVNFTAGTGGYPEPSTYKYSLNGGAYIDSGSATSPLKIEYNTLNRGETYNITIIATNVAGDTAPSNTKTGFVPYPCFLQGSKILRLDPETDIESYVPIETLKPGDLIRTSQNGHKAIFYIGKKTLPNPENDPNPKNRLYRFSKSKIPEMREDLCVTGEHCILYKILSPDLKRQVEDHMGEIYITEDCYRVPACLDKRAIPYKGDGPVTIWHFALESKKVYNNYGVYANGLLVESCSIQYLTEYANMELV